MVRRLTSPLQTAHLLLAWAAIAAPARAADPLPADAILPATTKCYISIADVDAVSNHWQQTALGRLVSHPAAQPFVEDVTRQFQENMSLMGRLGTDWTALRELPICGIDWAIVQPEHDPKRVAVAFVGRVARGVDASTVLDQLLANLASANVKTSTVTLAEQKVRVVEWPRLGRYDQDRFAYFMAEHDLILASDQKEILAEMVRRRNNETESLRQFQPFVEVMRRCAASSLDAHEIRWFVEPFGFAETLRAANGGRRKRGRDLLQILPRQGFSAIQGVGGLVRMDHHEFDNLSHTYVYAPAAEGRPVSSSGERFVLAARMLSFPNHASTPPPDWIPANVGSYMVLRCRLGEAFEYSKTLVDDLAAQPVFEDVLKSIEMDPNGPQVNLRTAIVRHLGERVVVLTEPLGKSTPQGPIAAGRAAGIAIELKDSQAVDKSLTKIMAQDPTARRVEHQGKVLWVVTTDVEESDGAADFGGFDSFAPPDDDFEQAEGANLFPNRVFFVAHDHLIVTTTESFAKKLLQNVPREHALAQSQRYAHVQRTLSKLGAADDCFRYFIRSSMFLESSYRQLQNSERFDLFDDFGLLMEKVWVDGKKLPRYEDVATDLGDSGIYVHAEDDGWRIVGFLLKSETSE